MNQQITAISLFEKPYEKINLWMPIVFIILALIEMAFQIQPTSQEKNTVLFFSTFIFFNHLHIFLTPILLFSYPEFKDWSRQSTFKSINVLNGIIWSGSILFIGLVLLYSHTSTLSKTIFVSLFVLRMLWGLYHNLFQNYGFLCLYNQKMKLSSGFDPLMKYCYLVFWIILGGNLTFSYLDIGSFKNSIYSYILTAVSFGLATYIIAKNWKVSKNVKGSNSNQMVYLFRLYLFVLSPHSLFAVAGYLAAHGIEYVLLFFHMRDSSQTKLKGILNTGFIFIFIFIFGLPFFSQQIPNVVMMSKGMQVFVVSFLFVADVVHYSLDSFMFKFSRLESRQNILPLITGTQKLA